MSFPVFSKVSELFADNWFSKLPWGGWWGTYHGAGNGVMGTRQVVTSQSLLFTPRFSHFSWISILWIVVNSLLISTGLKMLMLTISVSFLLWRQNFQRSLHHHFCWCHNITVFSPQDKLLYHIIICKNNQKRHYQ